MKKPPGVGPDGRQVVTPAKRKDGKMGQDKDTTAPGRVSNAALWRIDARIQALLDELYDEDGVVNDDAEAELDELEEARPVKIEACLLWVKNQRAMAEQIRKEELALAERRRRYEASADWTEKYVARHLAGERFETPKVLATFRKSKAVELDEGAEEHWTREQFDHFCQWTYKVAKAELKKALEAGEEVPGARIVERQNMTVR